MAQFSRKPHDSGFSQVPHGLWTAEISPGARCLLGWLYSHSADFLPHVTVNMIRRVFRTSSAAKWLTELEQAGFLVVTKGGAGKHDSYELLNEPWDALHQRRRHRAETGSVVSATEPKPARDRAETGAPKPARVEDQGEHITEEEDSPPPPAKAGGRGVMRVVSDDGSRFPDFWHRYPRKIDVRKCERWWAKATDTDRQAAEDGLQKWIDYWTTRAEPDKIPHPYTWLYNRRWEADPPAATAAPSRGSTAVLDQLRKEGLIS